MRSHVVPALAALLLLSGCQTEIPVCAPEDPAYMRVVHACLAEAPELRKALLDGYDFRRCDAVAAAQGLHRRNKGSCYTPEIIDYYRRRFNELPPNIKLPPGDPRTNIGKTG